MGQCVQKCNEAVAVAAWPEARNVFSRPNTDRFVTMVY
jgi:hypothetical protein